jgi:hypothetical protein
MYIRISDDDPAYFGNVHLEIHRHGCSNETTDVCFLEANEQPTVPPWPIGSPINADDTAYFEINSPSVTNPRAVPNKYVQAYALYASGTVSLKLMRFPDDPSEDADSSVTGSMPLVVRDTYERHARYVLAVGRSDFAQAPSVGYTTNLTIMHGTGVRHGVPFSAVMRLVCSDEQGPDFIGSDEDAVRIYSDGKHLIEFLIDDVDAGDEPEIQTYVAPIYFSDTTRFFFDESDDGFFTGGDDHFPPTDLLGLEQWDPTREPWDRKYLERFGIVVPIPLEEEYSFVYNLSRHL